MKHIGLFEGIGGFSLAARWMGWETIAWCEWNEFGQKVLKHHFPKAKGHGDITKTDFTIYRGECDILTGGFPCQPYSMAGKRLGKEDSRHLWPEMCRAIREIQPTWVVGENVLGLVNWNGGMVFDEVQADLEAQGYEVQPYVLPACAVNAPHRRDRVWFVAYSDLRRRCREKGVRENDLSGSKGTKSNNNSKPSNTRLEEWCRNTIASDTDSNGQHGSNGQYEVNASQGGQYAQCDTKQGNGDGNAADTISIRGREDEWFGNGKSNEYDKDCPSRAWDNFPTQSPICSRNDGLSSKLDGITFPKWRQESIKAAGNAIVPQVALQIFKTIQTYTDHA